MGLTLLAAALLSISNGTSFAREPPTPSGTDVLRYMTAYAGKIKSYCVVAAWEDWGNRKTDFGPVYGKTRWENITVFGDDLGRLKAVRKAGAFTPNGAQVTDSPEETYYLYDGEKTVRHSTFATLDVSGHLPKQRTADPSSDGRKLGYRTATIVDGAWPRRGGTRAAVRNPLTIVDWRPKIEMAIQQSHAIEVVPEPGAKGLYSLRYVIGAQGPDQATVVNTVDSTRGWIILKAAQCSKGRGIGFEEEFTYEEGADGLWVPKTGRRKDWSEWGGPPTKGNLRAEIIFTVDRIEINDPKFLVDAFHVSFEPGTAVHDERYKADYRVGDETVVDAQLEALARNAAIADEQLGQRKLHRVRSRWFTRTTLVALPFILAICIAALRWRRTFGTRGAGNLPGRTE